MAINNNNGMRDDHAAGPGHHTKQKQSATCIRSVKALPLTVDLTTAYSPTVLLYYPTAILLLL